MIKNSPKQTGSTHIFIIVIVIVAIIGALGFVFWQNYTTKKESSNSTPISEEQKEDEKEAVVAPTTKAYDNEQYEFSYLDDGWKLKEPGSESAGPMVKSNDFTSEPFRVLTGAVVYINSFPSTTTFEQRLKGNMKSIYTEVAKVKVDGLDADSYKMSYEGVYYITEFVKDKTTYQIRFEVADGKKSQYEDAYKLVVSSFRFK